MPDVGPTHGHISRAEVALREFESEPPRHMEYREAIARTVVHAQLRDEAQLEFVRRTMGRVYHERNRVLGKLVFSEVVTFRGIPLYMSAGAGDYFATVREDPDGELSGRQAEARDLPANFRLLYVELDAPMNDDGTPDSQFLDVVYGSTEDYDSTDVEILPAPPITPGMLTHREVYGVLEGSVEMVRSL